MGIFLDILKFLVASVYCLFLVDSMLNIKYELFDKDDKDENSFSWIDVVYFVYASFNFILIVKVLHGL